MVVTQMGSRDRFLSLEIIIALVLSFAVMQLFVQLIFFLHLGFEKGPKWNLVFFVSTVGIILIIVLGTLWIMYHLNYNMMPKQMEEYLLWKEGIHR
jgi:cytochrome o ubiquinol oxidase operon protein cyoD